MLNMVICCLVAAASLLRQRPASESHSKGLHLSTELQNISRRRPHGSQYIRLGAPHSTGGSAGSACSSPHDSRGTHYGTRRRSVQLMLQ